MNNLRLGYACINTVLADGPKKKRISVNNSCIAKTFREKGVDYVIDIARKNLKAVLQVLEWNEIHGIKLYRMSSDMIPHITNPEFLSSGNDYAYSLDHFQDLFEEIGHYAKKHHHRLTFHPSQFNQVGAIDRNVFIKTNRDLKLHAEILDRMGCDKNSVIVVHGGGSYGNKTKTIERWIKQFFELDEIVQKRLVIENCERQYNYKDMLYISSKINRPVVFDTHHHNCYHDTVCELPDPSVFIHEIIKTWTDLGIIPKFHISEQAQNKRVGAHSDYVETIPEYFFNLLKNGEYIDIMIEAKAKEQAVLELYSKYYSFNDETNEWDI